MIVLDTHAWIWWTAEPAKLSPRARAAVEAAEELGIAAISVWELATLIAKKRLELDRDVLAWVRRALALPRVALLPLTPEIAAASTRLPSDFPGDPADRIIVATAREHGAAVVSKDARLKSAPGLKTIW